MDKVWQDRTIDFFGIVIPALIAILIFNKGFTRDRALAREQREEEYRKQKQIDLERRIQEESDEKVRYAKEMNQLGLLLHDLLIQADDYIKGQRAEIHMHYEICRTNNFNDHVPNIHDIAPFKRLEELEVKEIREFFSYGKLPLKWFSLLLSDISYFIQLNQNIIYDYLSSEGNDAQRRKVMNEAILIEQRIMGLARSSRSLLESSEGRGAFLSVLSEMLYNHVVTDLNRFKSMEINMVDRLKSFLINNPFIKDPSTIEYEFMELAYLLGNILKTVKDFNSDFARDSMLLKTILDKKSDELMKIRLGISDVIE